MQKPNADISLLLARASHGDRAALDVLFPLLYEELRRLASSFLVQERGGHTLGTTGLIHEAFLRLVQQRSIDAPSRGMFFGIAATTMRRILVDHARARHALKRSASDARVTLTSTIEGESGTQASEGFADVLDLEQALEALGSVHERCARLVELRFYVGMSVDDAAQALGISPRQAANDWKIARAYLGSVLSAPSSAEARATMGGEPSDAK